MIHQGLNELHVLTASLVDEEVKGVITKIGQLVTSVQKAISKQMEETQKMDDQWQSRLVFVEKAVTDSTSSDSSPKKKYHVDIGKASMNLSTFNNNRDHFIEWNDKLLNVMSRLHSGSRAMFKECNRRWSKKDVEFNFCTDVKRDIDQIDEDAFDSRRIHP